MEFLSKKEMQVFITTTCQENILLDDRENSRTFLVEAGKVLH